MSYSSHVMSPAALLHAYRELYGNPPAVYLLEIRGERFELGEALSPEASINLKAAFNFLRELRSRPDLREWEQVS